MLNSIVDLFFNLNFTQTGQKKKSCKYGQKITYALEKGTVFTTPIFWTLTATQQSL